MDKKSYYAIIPADVRYDTNLTANAKLLYGEITALCNEKGYCWATNAYFAELYGVSTTSVSLWIKSLIDGGYITSKMIYKENNAIENREIRITHPIKENLNTPLRKLKHPIKENLNTPLRKLKHPIKENLNTPIKENLKDNNTYMNNTNNNIHRCKAPSGSDKLTKINFEKVCNELEVPSELRAPLLEFMEMRKSIKKPLTINAFKRACNKLKKLSRENNERIKIIENAIDHCWQGFYELDRR